MDLMSLAEMHQRPEDPYLPPGFRFHPTDEEIVYYLTRKVLFSNFRISAITEVDLNKCEPWDLPAKATMGEKEWYFYTLRDRKYPTGMRTNRATEAGYWKATGKDRNVMSSRTSSLVGMKKTLVFYRGRAPKGVKSNWIMHEYRLEGEASHLNRHTKMPKDAEWVVCRIFQKIPGGKNGRDSANKKAANSHHFTPSSEGVHHSSLPPLMEEPTRVTVTEEGAAESDSSQNDQVPSFSGNSYSMLKERSNGSAWFPKDPSSTGNILQQQQQTPPHPPPAPVADTSEAVNTVLKVPPSFFAPASHNGSLAATLEQAHSSYSSSGCLGFPIKYHRPSDFQQFQQQQQQQQQDPVSSPSITSLKALDQFSRALTGPFSIGKAGIRACKVEPRVESRAPGFQAGFRPLDTSVAGWLAENQSLSNFCSTQLQVQECYNPEPTSAAVAAAPGTVHSLNLYRLVAPSGSSGEMEAMWNY